MAGRTIGKRWNREVSGDYAWPCSYCGVKWRRSQLRVVNGLYVCPDEGDGLDSMQLTEGNADLTPDWGKGQSGKGYTS